jgi:hypothetical protein
LPEGNDEGAEDDSDRGDFKLGKVPGLATGEQDALNSRGHKLAENNEATTPQMAAQSPSDKSEIRIKYVPVPARS